MASQLIKEMTGPWKPEDFSDKFTTAIHALAAQRVAAGKTEKVTALEDEAPAASSNVVDLTELLRQSLGAKKPGVKSGGAASSKASKAEAAAPAKKAAAKKTARKKAA